MSPASASLTNWPSTSATASVKRAAPFTGLSIGRSSAAATSRSISPNAGARCTMPLPSSVVTKSAATTRQPSPSAGSQSNGRS